MNTRIQSSLAIFKIVSTKQNKNRKTDSIEKTQTQEIKYILQTSIYINIYIGSGCGRVA
jgi:hypothetical protein